MGKRSKTGVLKRLREVKKAEKAKSQKGSKGPTWPKKCLKWSIMEKENVICMHQASYMVSDDRNARFAKKQLLSLALKNNGKQMLAVSGKHWRC